MCTCINRWRSKTGFLLYCGRWISRVAILCLFLITRNFQPWRLWRLLQPSPRRCHLPHRASCSLCTDGLRARPPSATDQSDIRTHSLTFPTARHPAGKCVVFRGRVVASNVWAATCEQRAVMVRATARVFDLRVANYGQREASDPEVLFNQICMINVPLYLFVFSERNNGTVNNFAIHTGRMSSINERKPVI